MRLTEVRLKQFRNLASVRLEVPPQGAILVGDNGQGKTNFLEAIHFLAQFRSFRGARHADAIAFGAEHFRVEGGIEYADGTSRTVAVAADRRERRVAVDGRAPARAADALGAVLAVLVTPDDLDLVAGGPDGRRRYLDALLSRTAAAYARSLHEYERVLRQRNELLRGSSRAAAHVLESWDEALVKAAVPLVTARAGLVERLRARFSEVAAAVAGEGERTDYALAYRPSVGAEAPADPDTVAAGFAAALRERFPRDRARGWTTAGPHRDDLAIRLGGRGLDRFGSQGERRTGAIALRLLEAEVLEADTGHRPILLLDDVFSELDEGRARRLLERIGEAHQRFVTTPRPLGYLDGPLARWDVTGGRIEPRPRAA